MQMIPDDPVIRNLERTGEPDGKTTVYICPVCGEYGIDTIYIKNGHTIGCDYCVNTELPCNANCYCVEEWL